MVNGIASGAKNHVSAFLLVFTLLKEQLQAVLLSYPLSYELINEIIYEKEGKKIDSTEKQFKAKLTKGKKVLNLYGLLRKRGNNA